MASPLYEAKTEHMEGLQSLTHRRVIMLPRRWTLTNLLLPFVSSIFMLSPFQHFTDSSHLVETRAEVLHKEARCSLTADYALEFNLDPLEL